MLVATEDLDPTADLVITELNRRRVPVLRVDPGRRGTTTLAARTTRDGWSGRLVVGDRSVDLANVRALYHRRPTPYSVSASEQGERFAAQEHRRGFGGVLGSLPGCLYVSHPLAIARAEYKTAQLVAAGRFGMPVPPTIITNDPTEAKAFCRQHRAIYKPLHAGEYTVDGSPAGIWAASVDPEEITGAVSLSPHLFQGYIDKIADIRATVVGDRVFCVRIIAPPGVPDWRAAYKSLVYEAVSCSDGIRRAMLAFLEYFGLVFGAFDFAVTADDVWWFLECNPNGQWAWLESATEQPIASALADLLQNGVTRA
ncbi:ATP-grasp ribosomal peptide maturase [Embleya sp. NPDC059237]|uniref:ATP-grasp ribosomal peptide maturase n=1 Tax=Embleya sp. NPDC059237 TaxID=3346784 RepID=UPI003694305F